MEKELCKARVTLSELEGTLSEKRRARRSSDELFFLGSGGKMGKLKHGS